MLRCVALDVVPSLVFAVGALTLLVPFAIARARHAFVGGLLWPFVADLSRDYPSSIVFAIGLNVLALLVALTWVLNYRRQQRFLETALLDDETVAAFTQWSYVSNVLGVVGAAMLPMYVLGQVATLPHRVAGAAFLGTEAIACIINSYLSYSICLAKREELETGVFVTIKNAPRNVTIEKLTALKKAKRGFLVELACSALFVMSLVVYLPVLYQVVPATRLTIQECLDRGLGDHYCKDAVRLDATHTSLWNYEADFAGYQVRAFAQLGCLLTLLTYALSFVVANNELNEREQQERDRLYQAATSRAAPLLHDADDEPRGRRRSCSRPGSPNRRCRSQVRSPSGSPPRRRSRSPTSPRPAKSYISV